MSRRSLVFIAGAGLVTVIVTIALTLMFTPDKSHPAYAAAVMFMNAAGSGDDATASALLADDLRQWVAENCPDGSVSACIDGYIPEEWGDLISAVFRRALMDRGAWDVQLVATYEKGQGFSGVCIYHRMEEVAPGEWRVAAWSGFISCDAAGGRLQGLRQASAPNRAP